MSTIDRSRKRPRLFVPRAVRVRNACVRHAARQLGLPVPVDADLMALDADVSLANAVQWWTNTHGRDTVVVDTGPRFIMRTAWVAAIALLGLAFSYGRVQ